MKTQKYFAPGYYNAQFLDTKECYNGIRLRFLVYNEEKQYYFPFCTTRVMTEKEALEDLEATSFASAKHNWHKVSIGLSPQQNITIFGFRKTSPWQIPQWAKDQQDIYRDTKTKKAAYIAEREAKDEKFKLANEIRRDTWRLYRGLDAQNGTMGCTSPFFRDYLESMFVEGMTHDNYGSAWEIDHVRPLSVWDLTEPFELSLAAHFTNCQPLFKEENRAKYNSF